MAEWLTHVLLAFALFTALGWVIEWIDEGWVAVGMIGSILPDLNRLELIVPADTVSAIAGVPFQWGGLHTIGGAVLLAGLGALLFDTRTRQWRAFLVLFGGALWHLIVDLPQQYADGAMLTNLYLFPIASWRPPTPGWYVSDDRWVVVGAALIALVVWLLDRYYIDRRPTPRSTDRSKNDNC